MNYYSVGAIQKYIVLMAFAFISYSTANTQDVKVRIITVSDLHATIFPFDFVNNTELTGSLAHVYSYVKNERLKKDQSVILLDNGDVLQGQPTGYYYNFVETQQPNLFGRVMNYMQFDAASVGNHDIETGPDVYNKLKEDFNFPWLAANILDESSGETYFKPYTIIEREGVRIAIIGLVTPSIPNWLPRKLWEGLQFTSMYGAANEWMTYIRQNENPHAVIGLFHSGAGPDSHYTADSVYRENAARYVGKFIPGFDAIFTAHDHQVRNETLINLQGQEVLMIAGAPYGRSAAVVDLHFNRNSNGSFELINKTSFIEDVSSIDPDPAFMKEFETDYKLVEQFVNKPLGKLENDLWSGDSYFGNSAFTDFIHSIQLEMTGADISFAAPLSYDATLQAGNLHMSDMFKLYQYENYLYIMNLSGREIKDYLEYSYGLWYSTMENENDHMMFFRKDQQGNLILNEQRKARFQHPFFNFDSAAGILYSVDLSKKVGARISIETMGNGEPFDLERIYTVAINSYRGSGGGGHLTQGAGLKHDELESRIIFVSERDMRSHIADFIQLHKTFAPEKGNNWTILPEEWVERARQRDYKLLFD